jgi:hypothetical protein
MSLESQIADLVTATNSLITTFNTKKSGIDAAVAAAIAAVPEMNKVWYVDQINGLDSNAGTPSAPFKSINKAVSSTPATGVCNVYLENDYSFDSVVPVSCLYLLVYGHKAATTGVTPKLKAKYAQINNSDGTVTTTLNGFNLYAQGANVELRNCDLVLPSAAGVNPAPSNTRLCSFIKTNAGSSVPPSIGVSLEIVNVTKAADFFGRLIGLSTSTLSLACYGTTFPSDFAGLYVNNAAAGATTVSIPNITSNLSTL